MRVNDHLTDAVIARTVFYEAGRRSVLACASLLVAMMASVAIARDLLVSVRGDQTSIDGRVSDSSGDPGVGDWVQLFDLEIPSLEVSSMAAGKDGVFHFSGIKGHRYRITVSAEEGHSVDSDIVLGPNARGRVVEASTGDTQHANAGFWPPPAWAVIGALLMLSMISALWFKYRRRQR